MYINPQKIVVVGDACYTPAGGWIYGGPNPTYDPLHDDAQAMELEDWLIERGELMYCRNTFIFNDSDGFVCQFPNIGKQMRRRNICECVAKMQAKRA